MPGWDEITGNPPGVECRTKGQIIRNGPHPNAEGIGIIHLDLTDIDIFLPGSRNAGSRTDRRRRKKFKRMCFFEKFFDLLLSALFPNSR